MGRYDPRLEPSSKRYLYYGSRQSPWSHVRSPDNMHGALELKRHLDAVAAYGSHHSVKRCGRQIRYRRIRYSKGTDASANDGILGSVRVSLAQGRLVKSGIHYEESTRVVFLALQVIACSPQSLCGLFILRFCCCPLFQMSHPIAGVL
jgi:hypothetical protein